jgi:hypothetical protein
VNEWITILPQDGVIYLHSAVPQWQERLKYISVYVYINIDIYVYGYIWMDIYVYIDITVDYDVASRWSHVSTLCCSAMATAP